MSLVWKETPTAAWVPFAQEYANQIRRGVKAIADRYAPEIEAWMKDNAPWTDRSSNSRQTLNAKVEQLTMDLTVIYMRHGQVVPGIFLELANQGRYSVLTPALAYFAPRIQADIRRMLS